MLGKNIIKLAKSVAHFQFLHLYFHSYIIFSIRSIKQLRQPPPCSHGKSIAKSLLFSALCLKLLLVLCSRDHTNTISSSFYFSSTLVCSRETVQSWVVATKFFSQTLLQTLKHIAVIYSLVNSFKWLSACSAGHVCMFNQPHIDTCTCI